MTKEVKLPLTTINKVLEYLRYKPFFEVSSLIAEINQQAVLEDSVDTTSDVNKAVKTKVKAVK